MATVKKFIPNARSVERLQGFNKRTRFITGGTVAAMSGGNYAPASIIPTGMNSVGSIPVSIRELAAKDAIFQTTLPG